MTKIFLINLWAIFPNGFFKHVVMDGQKIP
jgi:hypothetical protein